MTLRENDSAARLCRHQKPTTTSSSSGASICILDENAPQAEELLVELHDSVLSVSFPPEEYLRPPALDEVDGPVLIACQKDGLVLGGALGEWYPRSESLLLAYLAVRHGFRAKGIGKLLMAAVVERWLSKVPLAFLELHDPCHYTLHPDYGDPVARLRFYDHFGVRILAIPYFQPSLAEHLPRAYHLLLGVITPEGVEPPPTIPGARVAAFIEEYFEVSEGSDALRNPEVQRLLEACAVPEISLLSLRQTPRVAVIQNDVDHPK